MPVSLEVTAPDTDVIHSWWIPALGGKIDAIPGVTNETWFQAENEGTYTGQCAELCGLEHAQMLASVEVMSSDEFDAWLDERRAEQDAGSGELGQEEWEGVCAKCHGPSGEGGIGPRIAGSPTLTDRDALASIVRNGRGTMPAVGSGWTDEQIAALARLPHGEPAQWQLEPRPPPAWQRGKFASWLVTTDHKRIGILYIATSLVFLVLAGLMALVMRLQLAQANADIIGAGSLQRARHDPRNDDGVPRRRPDPRRVRELPRAAHDRHLGHGVPASERALVLVLRRSAAPCSC